MHGDQEPLYCALSCERTYCTTARVKQPSETRLAQLPGRETVTVLAVVTLETATGRRRTEPSALDLIRLGFERFYLRIENMIYLIQIDPRG